MSENVNINELNMDDVQDKEFVPIKTCTTLLKVDDIKAETDDKGRNLITIRHAVSDPSTVETVEPGEAGSIFNRLYFHRQEAMGFVKRFVEAHGVEWGHFKEMFTTFCASGEAWELFTPALQEFLGLEAQAKVVYDSQYENNKIKKYIKPAA